MAKPKITKGQVEIDLTGVQASDRRRKTQIPEGTYNAKVVEAKTKKFGSGSKGVVWIFEVTDGGSKSVGARLWYNNVLVDAEGNVATDNLWSFRGVLQALEPRVRIPDKMIKVPLAKMANKRVALEVVDGEYEGKIRSEISDVFHPDLLDDEDDLEEEEDDLEEEDDDEDEDDEEEDDDEIDLDEDEL